MKTVTDYDEPTKVAAYKDVKAAHLLLCFVLFLFTLPVKSELLRIIQICLCF